MIRYLKKEDLKRMMAWMKDANVTNNMQADFEYFSEDKVMDFIEKASKQNMSSENFHYAITDENDQYMGTISLKNIDHKNKNAEYAIVTCSEAHGKGYAKMATTDILEIAFSKLELEKVYLYVSEQNIAANKFYKKYGFVQEGIFRKHLMINNKLVDILWYSILKEDFNPNIYRCRKENA